MDSGLDENESELGVGVLSVLVEVLSHRHSLLDKVVEILGNLGGKASLSAVFKTWQNVYNQSEVLVPVWGVESERECIRQTLSTIPQST